MDQGRSHQKGFISAKPEGEIFGGRASGVGRRPWSGSMPSMLEKLQDDWAEWTSEWGPETRS